MKNTLIQINKLASNGIIEKYAIGGGIACAYYVEPTTTYDLDVMIILSKEENPLNPLKEIYDWAKLNDFQIKEEHIIIDGIPVQFLPVYSELVKDAVNNAKEINLYGIKTFIFTPEYLISIMLDTFRAKDKMRIVQIIEETKIDDKLLETILNKYNLTGKYKSLSE